MQTCGANSEKLPTIPLIMMMVMTMITESETNWDLSLELTPHWWSFLLRLRLLIYRIRTFPQTDQIYVTWMNMVIITSRENYAIKIGIWIAVIKINPKLKFSALNLDRWLQGVTILTLLIGFGYSINGSDFSGGAANQLGEKIVVCEKKGWDRSTLVSIVWRIRTNQCESFKRVMLKRDWLRMLRRVH